MKALLFFALAILVLATAFSTGWEVMFRLFYTLVVAMVVSYVWARGNVHWLWHKYEIKTNRAEVGGKIEERLTLENSSFLPKLWLQIRDHSTLIGRRGNRVVALGAYARRTFDLVTPCNVRGEFTLGPVQVESGDPFGLFRARKRLDVGGKVLVYPRITRLVTFGRLPGELPGGNIRTQRTPFSTPNAAGIREYQPGDSLNRIHWPSSARLTRLMVKEFDLDPMADVWLILDLDEQVQAGAGQDSTVEWVVSTAASLAAYFTRLDRQLGLITQRHVVPADRGERQLHKLLDLLAVVKSDSSMPLEEMILSEETRFGRGATAVVITPSSDERWLAVCKLLLSRRIAVMAVMLDASTFGGKETPLLALSSLAAAGVPTYLVRRGDNLAEALSSPSGGGQRSEVRGRG